ncbi:MAG TPA: EAL domain-containing protein [Polyangiaceae bacterium]|nr:EAL domain-containing protein [Polyangiaceae bacterium]
MQSQSNAPGRVLVADDEPALLRLVVRALEQAGHTVVSAEDGDQALALVQSQDFDAILTDVSMPGITGVALLKAVRAKDLDVPVLLMTGAPGLDSANAALKYGAFDYLTKPVTMPVLLRAVGRAVELNRLARARREVLQVLDTGRPEAGDLAGFDVTLDRALSTLWMAYQPIVDVSDRSVFGYEALLRSAEPSLPHPGAVLDAAERAGRLRDVGRAVRARAPQAMAAGEGPLLFLNLHSSDLNDEELFASGSPLAAIASRVVLEITERASLDSVADVRTKVGKLREIGYRIAVDDLGAGYAGLTSFAQLEPEFVKLDMSLVRDVHLNPVKRKLVRSMSDLCRDMGILVVAEGIETAAERDVIVDIGCTLLQGYLFARPGKAFPVVTW